MTVLGRSEILYDSLLSLLIFVSTVQICVIAPQGNTPRFWLGLGAFLFALFLLDGAFKLFCLGPALYLRSCAIECFCLILSVIFYAKYGTEQPNTDSIADSSYNSLLALRLLHLTHFFRLLRVSSQHCFTLRKNVLCCFGCSRWLGSTSARRFASCRARCD